MPVLALVLAQLNFEFWRGGRKKKKKGNLDQVLHSFL